MEILGQFYCGACTAKVLQFKSAAWEAYLSWGIVTRDLTGALFARLEPEIRGYSSKPIARKEFIFG